MIRRLLLLFSVYIMLNMKLIKTQSNNHNKTNNVAIVTVVNVNDNDDDNVNDEYETFITLTKNTIHTRNRYSNELIEEEEQFEEIEESIVMPDYQSIENDSLNITRNSSNVNNTNSSSLSSPTLSVLSQLQNKQINLQHHSEEQQQLSIDHILSKVKDAEQFNALNNHKMKTEPDELIIAPVRFNRLRRYFRHQKRMMRAQYRMMRLQRRLYRRHYRRPYGYGYFP
ncbi:hypothetical protein KSF78_0005569 [Schistosoma japonicum]|nr:hypothetical protein KSF78_0005569 [Schistosoma japonicum]